ncbi:MAG: hypothetical protein BJ554DRAFT_7191 [Olpidium bornovanus]|uniref:Uncharacterized protein n=1 Tax=Olpidium bornovanus TaxID=278681 RepID=A0A8H8DJD1_9FUNG|nr:MAG: hypothetical protein BJ554DRAFT_7191 [Olpidium bornovanus]
MLGKGRFCPPNVLTSNGAVLRHARATGFPQPTQVLACQVLRPDRENLLMAYRSVAQCLQDPELPVRVQAAIALTALLDKEEGELARPAVRGVICFITVLFF